MKITLTKAADSAPCCFLYFINAQSLFLLCVYTNKSRPFTDLIDVLLLSVQSKLKVKFIGVARYVHFMCLPLKKNRFMYSPIGSQND